MDKPFIYLIDNLDKVDIDERLIPIFKEMLMLMEEYFEKNDLLDTMDFISFFDKYYINDSEDKIKLVVKKRTEADWHSCYDAENHQIRMNDDELFVHHLCHEFIHSLAHKMFEETKKDYDRISSELFLNEGATENLARKISGDLPKNSDRYNDNVAFSEFLENLYGKKEFYKLFFSGEPLIDKIFKDDSTAKEYLIILRILRNYNYREAFYKKNKNLNPDNYDNLFIDLENILIQMALKNYPEDMLDFKSINDLINFAKRIATRPLECRGRINDIFEKAIYKYLSKFDDGIDDYDMANIIYKISDILGCFDQLYLYGVHDFASVRLENEDGNDFMDIYIDKDYNPVKSDIFVNKTQLGFFVHENSNDKDRMKYRVKNFKKEDIDFTKDVKIKENNVRNSLNILFNSNYSILFINELLMEYCNIDTDSLSSDNIDQVLEQLKNNIDPFLFETISDRIKELSNSYGLK